MTPLEPWEKVLIELTGGNTSFKDIDQIHGLIGCINCHGGVEPSSAIETAHSIDHGFIRDPSSNPEEFCNPCHNELVESNKNSMHTMAWGEKTTIAQRELGAESNHTDFDACPESLTNGFDGECTSCHTTCGQCHVSRPNSAHGGLIDNHKFNRIPDQTNNCMACHGSRIGTDFKGELTGNIADVHYLNRLKCFDCHVEDFHADASQYESRYHLLKDEEQVQCDYCHGDVTEANEYHQQHWPTEGEGLSCFVCHSQPYNNCNTCHSVGEWKEGYGPVAGETDVNEGGNGYLEYPDFKIGINNDYELRNGKWAVLRHIPVAPDSYTKWGHMLLTNFDARPTWEVSTPHNIKLWTSQTDTTNSDFCSDNCHNHGVRYDAEGTMSNYSATDTTALYLKTEDLIENEINANESVLGTYAKVGCNPCHPG